MLISMTNWTVNLMYTIKSETLGVALSTQSNSKKLSEARCKKLCDYVFFKHKKNRFISEPVLPCGERGKRTYP